MKRGEMAHYKMIDRKPIYPNNQYNAQVCPFRKKSYPSAHESYRDANFVFLVS